MTRVRAWALTTSTCVLVAAAVLACVFLGAVLAMVVLLALVGLS